MDSSNVLVPFFRMAFQDLKGHMTLCILRRGPAGMKELWFDWPQELGKLIGTVEKLKNRDDLDVYFCPQLFGEPTRKKPYVSVCPTLWADLDSCPPDELELHPSLVTETSPGRYQALWVVEGGLEPKLATDFSKRIAYQYAEKGADKSGWDLTQLLRVPETRNNKYASAEDGPVVVRVLGGAAHAVYRANEFEVLPPVQMQHYELLPFPEKLPGATGIELLERFRYKLTQAAFEKFEKTPIGDWSKELFALMMLCFEAGMSREEVFKVADSAACNKFARDARSPEFLWQDVCRAWWRHHQNYEAIAMIERKELALLTPEEEERVHGIRTFVEDYIDWASGLGDAAVQYHQGGAFIILSALLAGAVSLPTSFGIVKPNLWFMILADTTLTRKSTAMDIAIDLLDEVDRDAVMATDGSIEGLMQGLSTRPSRPSVFLRDEFSGLLEMIAKKDYYAGMAEVLTKLYDGRMQRRMLRKETIEVRDPVLILFAGGIKTRVQQILKVDHVSSGFIPRFLFLTAESDVDRVLPLGPPTDVDTSGRDELLDFMNELKDHYGQTVRDILPNGVEIPRKRKWEARLTTAAWQRYNQFERDMVQDGLQTERPEVMTPLFDRLCKSTLKAIVLLAASRQREDEVVVNVDDVLLGIRYAREWREYAIEVVNGIGMTIVEQQISSIAGTIKKSPGISRSALMRNHHLTAREADAIFATLEQRGLITKSQIGRGWAYTSIG